MSDKLVPDDRPNWGTCSAPGCERPIRERWKKYCSGHNSRLKAHGSLGDTPIKDIPPRGLSRFAIMEFHGWDVTASGCWEYRGPRFAKGYGEVKTNGRPKLAHRVSYEHYVGPIPEGLVVRHKCDNPPCMNPAHLELGTTNDNVQDRNSRGRTAWGCRGVGKFTDNEVISIRAEIAEAPNRYVRGRKYREIAAREGVDESTVQKMWLRVTYSQLPGGQVAA